MQCPLCNAIMLDKSNFYCDKCLIDNGIQDFSSQALLSSNLSKFNQQNYSHYASLLDVEYTTDFIIPPDISSSSSSSSQQGMHISGDIPTISKPPNAKKPFRCDLCSLVFGRYYDLRVHKKNIHDKIKRFKCNECDLSFGYRGDLNAHQSAVHKKLQPYKCLLCDKSFSYKSNLSKHIKAVHNANTG